MTFSRVYLVVGVFCMSILAVYTQYVFLDMTDYVTHRTFRDLSLEQYHETLEGRRWFPFQWRVAAPWLVRAGERATRLDPHILDVALKVLALTAATLVLMIFTNRWTGPLGAIVAGLLYVVLTTAAFAAEGYTIYFTNDYLLLAGWFSAVELVARRRIGAAAIVTFLTAWAKETIVLVPIVVALAWLRGKATWRDVAWCGLAVAVPTAILRLLYPAPLKYWAWWSNVERNVPFIRTEPTIILLTLRNNLKVLLFFNVLWILAASAAARTRRGILQDLVYAGTFYLTVAYLVMYVRELRHFLPLAIVVIPLAVTEIERRALQVRSCRQDEYALG